MMRPGWPGDGTPSLESLRELRFRALLNDLVKDLGQVKAAADQFGVAGAGTGEGPVPAGKPGAAALGAAGADPGAVAELGCAGAGVDVGDCDGSGSGVGSALRF